MTKARIDKGEVACSENFDKIWRFHGIRLAKLGSKSKILRYNCWVLILDTSSTRTRRGGSCLKDIYNTFLIYRTCMRRAPAKPVRACTLRN